MSMCAANKVRVYAAGDSEHPDDLPPWFLNGMLDEQYATVCFASHHSAQWQNVDIVVTWFDDEKKFAELATTFPNAMVVLFRRQGYHTVKLPRQYDGFLLGAACVYIWKMKYQHMPVLVEA